jgi:hypothetical protein
VKESVLLTAVAVLAILLLSGCASEAQRNAMFSLSMDAFVGGTAQRDPRAQGGLSGDLLAVADVCGEAPGYRHYRSPKLTPEFAATMLRTRLIHLFIRGGPPHPGFLEPPP